MNSSEKNLKKENNIHYVNMKEDEKKDELNIMAQIEANKFSEKDKEEIFKNYKKELLKEIGVILIIIYNKNIKTTLQVENEKIKKENEDSEKRLEKFKKQISYC